MWYDTPPPFPKARTPPANSDPTSFPLQLLQLCLELIAVSKTPASTAPKSKKYMQGSRQAQIKL
jgi:hypothetical protein